ncbi:formamidopyrimidine-DNA glycosylase isoform X2 [Impatiens glandulifera]|uniref:formamidopyrimidine-DNA glycosylase isoform X2 n=1 Tax=Impatiens glandulifera TaxID=253017 RepID=UPI001FB089C3|nr:formamidopyrimidine-DNA glycosylase isoform X2 [Impatiens glandulifera]
MPELPEVEAARRAIELHCVGKKILRAVIAEDDKVIVDVSPSDFEASIFGKLIVAAHRKGKNMWLQLDSPPYPTFQFGMAGAIYIKGVAVTKYKRSAVKDTDEWPSKYSKFFIELDDGLELSFTDKRRFARVRLLKNPAIVAPISELGPDALMDPMTVDDFIHSLSKFKKDIKTVILDQKFISGIGNWIADEVLYQARIHPLQKASSLSKDSCKTLQNCIKEVIQYAVEVDADCSRFPLEWIFHSRWGKKPGRMNGKKIEFISAGGRTTAFVPELQKLEGVQASEVVVPRKSGKKTGKGSKDVEDGSNLVEQSEEEENGEPLKSKGVKKNTTPRAGKKKAPAKGKINNNDNDEEEDEDEDDDNSDIDKTKKNKPQIKRSAKRKPKDNSDGDESEYSGDEKKQKTKMTSRGSKKNKGK